MSLLDEFARSCALLEEKPVPDGAGGWKTAWRDAGAFIGYRDFVTSSQVRSAERDGVSSVCTMLVERSVPIQYGDYFRELPAGLTYRVTSKPEERQSPRCATMPLKAFTVERGEPPT